MTTKDVILSTKTVIVYLVALAQGVTMCFAFFYWDRKLNELESDCEKMSDCIRCSADHEGGDIKDLYADFGIDDELLSKYVGIY